MREEYERPISGDQPNRYDYNTENYDRFRADQANMQADEARNATSAASNPGGTSLDTSITGGDGAGLALLLLVALAIAAIPLALMCLPLAFVTGSFMTKGTSYKKAYDATFTSMLFGAAVGAVCTAFPPLLLAWIFTPPFFVRWRMRKLGTEMSYRRALLVWIVVIVVPLLVMVVLSLLYMYFMGHLDPYLEILQKR
ncbi:MAG: hypothetical protein JNL52_12410 [Flavobacteriales bacterium]|nr:hypothetical protein [Flavobacteriales bacterium]